MKKFISLHSAVDGRVILVNPLRVDFIDDYNGEVFVSVGGIEIKVRESVNDLTSLVTQWDSYAKDWR